MKTSILFAALLTTVSASAMAAAPAAAPAAAQTAVKAAAQVAAQAAAPALDYSSPEATLARMSDMTTNTSAFKDPKNFVRWLNTTTEPGFYTVMGNSMLQPNNWTKMMATGLDPRALTNYMQFTDPAVAAKWMAASMDPQFYTAMMTPFMDPAKSMRWMMMPMDPKVWNLGMQMLNPQTSMNWMMAPISPQSINLMMAPMNPNLYTSWMSASMNPATYGSMGALMNPATYGAMDMSALTNMITPMMAPVTAIAPAAAAAVAPAAAAVAAPAKK